MDVEEPNWILPEKRSSVKYSPLRLRIVLRSCAVHDLRRDFAWRTTDDDDGSRAYDANATAWRQEIRIENRNSSSVGAGVIGVIIFVFVGVSCVCCDVCCAWLGEK